MAMLHPPGSVLVLCACHVCCCIPPPPASLRIPWAPAGCTRLASVDVDPRQHRERFPASPGQESVQTQVSCGGVVYRAAL